LDALKRRMPGGITEGWDEEMKSMKLVLSKP